MNSGAPHLNSNDRIEEANSSLEGFQVAVLVREHPEASIVDTKTYTCVNVFFGRLEPGIALGLQRDAQRSRSQTDSGERQNNVLV